MQYSRPFHGWCQSNVAFSTNRDNELGEILSALKVDPMRGGVSRSQKRDNGCLVVAINYSIYTAGNALQKSV
jgi:hypothetical protein